ncbi:ASCH domain-containing protein [Rhodococcus sp. 06-418-5]|uniref:ASCH domain-containing protein n=1 Tax=Rhodococcus sp. 06-418-5 TaxID=2022507 RepID=UPI00211ABD2F|nr:ASCH domain-containing protein [Rhodococcus sp. 06-418-5]
MREQAMKALTVQQPWAWAIMHGSKVIENRTQNWNYRGPLAIHAGQRWSDRGEQSPLVSAAYQEYMASLAPLTPGVGRWVGGKMVRWVFPLGAILGVVDLVDVHPESGCCKPWGEAAYVEHGGRERRRIVHLVLENPRPLAEPFPCRGALGLWTPPAELSELIA